MARFEDAIDGLLRAEGGFAEKDNTAGSVMCGITERFLRDHHIDLDGDQDTDRQDVVLVTKEIASNLYKRYFWNPLRLDEVKSQRVAELMFHMAVNQGLYWGAAHAQKTANCLGATLLVDGNIGPKSLAAINDICDETRINRLFYEDDFISGYKAQALVRYERLAARWPAMYADDLPGWKRRLEALG